MRPGYKLNNPVFESLQGQDIFIFRTSRPAVRSPSFLLNWCRVRFPEVKTPRFEIYRRPICSTEMELYAFSRYTPSFRGLGYMRCSTRRKRCEKCNCSFLNFITTSLHRVQFSACSLLRSFVECQSLSLSFIGI